MIFWKNLSNLIDLFHFQNEKIFPTDLSEEKKINWAFPTKLSLCTYPTLDKYILTLDIKKKKNKIEDKVVSDCCEGLIGSIYLDKGFNSVEKFILELWSENIKDSVITQIDAKTKLQEFSLKRFKKLPIYKLISNTGPRHKPLSRLV